MRIVVLASIAVACGRIGIDPLPAPLGVSSGRDCAQGPTVYHSGETFALGDNCNSCTCNDGTIACTTNTCADACVTCPDGSTAAVACDPSGGCPVGPICGGGLCCGTGEQCAAGVCTCNGGPACTLPDTCASNMGQTPAIGCGTVCCHGATCGA